jgi:uncharacterized protein
MFTVSSSNHAKVIFHTDQGSFSFSCEIAKTLEEKQQGLRDVTNLPIQNGMLFVYDSMQPLIFTMNGMSIPLDIIFINANSSVSHIIEADIGEEHISSDGPAQYVIELNQGLTSQYNITIGTSVELIFDIT